MPRFTRASHHPRVGWSTKGGLEMNWLALVVDLSQPNAAAVILLFLGEWAGSYCVGPLRIVSGDTAKCAIWNVPPQFRFRGLF